MFFPFRRAKRGWVWIGIITALWICVPHASAGQTFETFAQQLLNRSSRNFERRGFLFAQPDYQRPDFAVATTPRDLMLCASTFRYRAQVGDAAALVKLQTGITPTIAAFANKPLHPSFENAQAAFLLVRMVDEVPGLVSFDDRKNILLSLKAWIGPSISAPDTENRAVISAANWQYLVNLLRDEGMITTEQKNAYSVRLKRKVDNALRVSITPDNWYRESGMFSAHYQAVTAFHLLAYGEFSGQPSYETKAFALYRNLKALAFTNGMTEAQTGNRPIGLGAQYYAMMGVLGVVAKDADAPVFLNFASGTRFFSDPRFPYRLEFHQTIEGSSRRFHDDIAFPSVTELAYVLPSFSTAAPLSNKTKFSKPVASASGSTFRLANTGRTVTVMDLRLHSKIRVQLGSYGNWTRLASLPY